MTQPQNVVKTRPSHWLLGRQVLHKSDPSEEPEQDQAGQGGRP